jgi:short-subunit dehydrogenase
MAQTRPLAAITGASSGIGAVFARKLASRGYDLLLIARRQEKLDALAAELRATGVDAAPCIADLADEGATTRVAERLRSESRLELLINNAGFGVKGRFLRTDVQDQLRMHKVHVMATVELTHAALSVMVPRDSGAVINVASVAAFARSQGNVSYCATKSWMTVFSEGLYLELKGSGSKVRVQALCPGFTHTEFHDSMGVDKRQIPQRLWLSADKVVQDSLDALSSGELFVVPGAAYKMFSAVMPRLPSGLRTWIEVRNPQSKGRL